MNIWTACPAESLRMTGFLFLETIFWSRSKGSKRQRLCLVSWKEFRESACQLNRLLGTAWPSSVCLWAFSHYLSTNLTSHVRILHKKVLPGTKEEHGNTRHAIHFCGWLGTRWPAQVVPKLAFWEVQGHWLIQTKTGVFTNVYLVDRINFQSGPLSVKLLPNNKTFPSSIKDSCLSQRLGMLICLPLRAQPPELNAGFWDGAYTMWLLERNPAQTIPGMLQLWWENFSWNTQRQHLYAFQYLFPSQFKYGALVHSIFMKPRAIYGNLPPSLPMRFSDTLQAPASSMGYRLVPQRNWGLFPEASIQNKWSRM